MPSLIFKRKQEGIEGVVVVVCEERPRNRTESVVVKANSSLLPDLENPNWTTTTTKVELELELEPFLTTPPLFFKLLLYS